ncbi:unnamed protein product [Gulo gulo]|uniref:Uncharacterized protein n=1 Tax=Gulo gulo TaxID=48420 RepID=A0A9X9LYH7_GULGU|nr:unnamed protein product [Gulo gulo]
MKTFFLWSWQKKSLQSHDQHQKDGSLQRVRPQADSTPPLEQFESLYTFHFLDNRGTEALQQALKTNPINTPEKWGENSRSSALQDGRRLPKII